MTEAKENEANKVYVPARYVLIFLTFWAAFFSYVFRTNLSLTMVAMVNQTDSNSTNSSNGQCPLEDGYNSTLQVESFGDGTYEWDMKTQSFLQGGFFYGYATTQILNGWLSSRLGAKYLIGGGMLLGSATTLIVPVLSDLGPGYLMAGRVVTGISQSVLYPSVATVFMMWIPPSERSRMYMLFNMGSNVGLLASMPIIGWLCEHGFAGGWPSVFYVFGSCGVVWVVFWFALAHDSPAKHPRISMEERKMILDSLPRIKVQPVPWLAILTSVKVWAYVLTLSSGSWIYYTRLTELPTYLNSALNFPIQKNALVNTMVTASAIVLGFGSGFLADALLNRRILTSTQTRKLMEVTAQFGCALALLGVNLSGCNSTLVILFLILSAGILSFSNVGAGVVVMEMAPTFSGTVFGLANTVAAITGFLSPLLTGYVVQGHDLFNEWHYVFYVSAGIGIFGSCFFLIFGTAEPQKWNEVDVEDDRVSISSKHSEKYAP